MVLPMKHRLLVVLAIAFLVLEFSSSRVLAVGALFVRPLNSNQTFELLSIKTYDVDVQIADHVATTKVDQLFRNETNQVVESTFIFPLPPGAVITDLYYWFNGQKYKGNVRERAEAQKLYDAKIRVRIDPALLQEIGDNVFKLNIAPINSNSDVRCEITYTEILPFSLGESTYTHFLKTTGLSPKPLERMSLRVTAETQTTWKSVTSPTYGTSSAHAIIFDSPSKVRTTLGDENYTPTRNYMLVLRTNRTAVDMGTLTYVPVPTDSFGVEPFFLSWVIPPDENANPIQRSVVFVGDVSSSMEGKRIEQLRDAMMLFIDQLQPHDRFNIITFSTNVVGFRADLVEATPNNLEQARDFVRTRTALGLTNISEALDRCLHQSFIDNTANIVVFLTDGQPSWGETKEAVIVDSMVKWNVGNARVYPITIGEEPNVSLMRNIAKKSGGFLTEIANDDDIVLMVNDHLRRISMPNLTNLSLDYGSLKSMDVLPAVLPNVPIGGRVVQTGRYEQGGLYPVTLRGAMGGEQFSLTKDVLFGDPTRNNRAVARLWAQAKIDALLEEISRFGEAKELVNAIIDLSIRFSILTKYTALYADPDDPDSHTTGVPEDQRPVEMQFLSIAPMPVTLNSIVTMQLDPKYSGERLRVSVVDLYGREVVVLYDGASIIGPLELQLQPQSSTMLASGTYILVARVGQRCWSKQFIVIKE